MKSPLYRTKNGFENKTYNVAIKPYLRLVNLSDTAFCK